MMLVLAMLDACSPEPPEQSLYRQYAARKELKVAQLNGFKLCDTVRVDVVMLQTDDMEGWQRLCSEFDIRGDEGTVSWLGTVDDPAVRTRWTGEPVLRVVASPTRRTIGFYRLDTEGQYDAIIDYQLNKLNSDKR